MKDHRQQPFTLIANLYGEPCDVTWFRRGTTMALSWMDFSEPRIAEEEVLSVYEIHAMNLRDILHAIDEYERSGLFSVKELLTVRKCWLEGWSLQRIGDAEGVSRQAVRERIVGNRTGQGGLLKKAPEFAEWWKFRHRHRRRRKDPRVD